MNKLSVLFGQYLSAPIVDTIADAKVYDVKINKEKRIIDIYADFDKLVDAEDVFATQRLIKSSSIQFSSVVIHPRYDSSLFDVSYFPQLVEFLKVDTPSLNGTLNEAQLFCKGNVLTVKLAHGGLSLLNAKDFNSLLQNILNKMFSLSFSIEYSGVTEIDGDSDEYIEQISNVEKKITRDKLEELSQMFEYEEKTSDKSTTMPKAIEKRVGEYALPQIIPETVRPLYGRITKGKILPIEKIAYDTGRATVWGDVFALEWKDTKSGDKNIITFDITDYTGSTTVKVFNNKNECKVLENIRKGSTIICSGDVEFDKYAGELVLNARSISTVDKVKVGDNALKKRVELHLHTNMSQMDGVTDAGSLVKRAAQWGHSAVAITDHGVAQAFPDAMNAAEAINRDENKIKVIYGVEAYFMDDLVESVDGDKNVSLDDTFICFDIETTGLSAKTEKITEIGAVKVCAGQVVDTFSTFVNPEKPIPAKIVELTGITDAMVKDAPSQRDAVRAFLEFCGDNVLVAHNAPFDTSFIKVACADMGVEYNYTSLDTVAICRSILPDIKNCKLDTVASYLRLGDF
ncbi:MAG: PHP domain-containing protein, partial [Ruminococcus sp.]|nr:PHP domain-containing protein [Ruminococcus sp.]